MFLILIFAVLFATRILLKILLKNKNKKSIKLFKIKSKVKLFDFNNVIYNILFFQSGFKFEINHSRKIIKL